MADLTDRDRDTLDDLHAATVRMRYAMPWARPLDIGGGNGSHHSNTLRKLERHGLVESKQRGWPDPVPGEPPPRWKPGRWNRGAKVYRLTEEGRALIEAARAARKRASQNQGEPRLPPDRYWVCPICDGGPGNTSACTCPPEWRPKETAQ